MGRWRDHRALQLLVLGKYLKEVDRWTDEPYKWLGPRHRILRHSPLDTLTLLVAAGPDAAAAHLVHLALDFNPELQRLVEVARKMGLVERAERTARLREALMRALIDQLVGGSE